MPKKIISEEGKKNLNYTKNPPTHEAARALGKASQTPAAQKKRSETLQYKKAIKSTIYDSIRETLLSQDKKGITTYETFIKNFLKEASADPNSKAGTMLAQQLLQNDILSSLDESVDKMIARDTDFARYRILKTLFKEQQLVLLDEKSRKKCIICSRRAGKTELNARALLYQSVKGKSISFYVNLTFGNAIAQCFQLVLDLAEEVDLSVKKSSKSEGEIEFSNGSKIYFRGNASIAEQEKYRGFKANLVIIDESQSQRRLNVFIDEIIAPLLMDFEDSLLLLTGTPPRIPKTYFEKAYLGKEFKSYNWSMADNPYIPNVEQVIQDLCLQKGLTKDSPLIQREYLGQLSYDTEAQVFKGYSFFTEEPQDFLPTHIYIGNDYGWSANNAIIGVAANKETKQAYVYYEDVFNKATVTQIIESNQKAVALGRELLLKNPNTSISNLGIYGDTSDTSTIYEMSQTYGLPAYQCYKHDKDLAIQQLSEMMRTGQLKIKENGFLANEAEMTLYKRDENDNLTSEVDDNVFHPDALMALLYASRQLIFDWS